jgi:heme o synthase
MIKERAYQLNWTDALKQRLSDYLLLIKFRLTFIVVFSAGIGFLYVTASTGINWAGLFYIMLSGFLITGSANALNEIFEKDFDKLMDRTKNRPLPAGRMGVPEALLIAGLMGFAGIFMLAFSFNVLSALIGALSLFSYAFIYTPLKRYTNFAVFVGAIPGALPPLIGWVAATGHIGMEALLLFSIQFIWQFPHFWAIAWISHDDYQKAGYYLLPSKGGKERESAIMAVIYTAFLIPISILPFFMGVSGPVSLVIVVIMGIVFLKQAIQLYKNCSDKSARKLMFGSFLYLPVVLLALLIDKV